MGAGKKTGGVIAAVRPGSPADRAGVEPGDAILAVGGERLRDVIDYQLKAAGGSPLLLTIERAGRTVEVAVDAAVVPPGIVFGSSVFDSLKVCRNRCVFCFIDQLPPVCRDSLLIKDDDFRLSFLGGNFITLTNLSEADVARVVDQRLSPLYVSIHSFDPRVRAGLIRPPKTDRAVQNLEALSQAGIELHVQIVVCPGFNDGDDLDTTLHSLLTEFPGVASVGVVPVGLTRHRSGLPALRPLAGAEAEAVLVQVEAVQAQALKTRGRRWVYAADEIYLSLGAALPPTEAYDDFPQTENGIGPARIFHDDVLTRLDAGAARAPAGRPASAVALVTSRLGSLVVGPLAARISEVLGIEIELIEAANHWLGGHVTVAALLAGSDIVEALSTSDSKGDVLVPGDCLNADGLFLDDMTLSDVSIRTGRRIRAVLPRGEDLVEALIEVGGRG